MSTSSMSPSLLELPPELLLQVLSLLPIRSLLNFSLASRTAHALSLSSLHTLSFGIYRNRLSSVSSRISNGTHPYISSTKSVFSQKNFANFLADSQISDSSVSVIDEICQSPFGISNTINLIIPEDLDRRAHYLFQSKLFSSVITRYQISLRTLDLCLWSLDANIADALCSLKSLRTLSLRIEDPGLFLCSRRRAAIARAEERALWNHLGDAWTRLTALRIECAEINVDQLITVLENNVEVRELWVRRCNKLGTTVFHQLASNPYMRSRLEVLSVNACGGEIDQQTLDSIGELKALKYLALLACHESVPGIVEQANSKIWRIPEVVVPKPTSVFGTPDIIEVDPAYADDNGDAMNGSESYHADTASALAAVAAAA